MLERFHHGTHVFGTVEGVYALYRVLCSIRPEYRLHEVGELVHQVGARDGVGVVTSDRRHGSGQRVSALGADLDTAPGLVTAC